MLALHAERYTTPLAARIQALEGEIVDLQLHAIAASVHNTEFSAAELLERTVVDPDVRYLLRNLTTPKQVGRRLLQLAAQPSRGVRLVRIARNEDGCIWIVEIQDDAGITLGAGV